MPNQVLNYSGSPIYYLISMTGVETPTEYRRFGYQLLDTNNNPISAIELKTVQDGEQFILDFQSDIFPELFTEIPQLCGTVNGAAAPEMTGMYKLKYWEQVSNKLNCGRTIEHLAETIPFRVINSAEQWYGIYQDTGEDFRILTFHQEKQFMCRDKCDLIYTWALDDELYYIRVDIFTSITNNVGSMAVKIPKDAYYHMVSARQAAQALLSSVFSGLTLDQATDLIHHLELSIVPIQTGITNPLTDIYLKDCCDVERVLFHHSLGGYTYMEFDCIEQIGEKTSYTEIFKYQPPADPYTNFKRTRGGNQIANKKARQTITLSKLLTRDDLRDLRYYQMFLSSGNYYYELNFMGAFGMHYDYDMRLVRFLPNSGSIRYYKKEKVHKLVLTGIIAPEFNYSNYQR